MPKLFSDPEAIAEDIIRDVGTNLVVGLPLGLGKANHIVNALYGRAVADRSIKLTFFSALTLEKPRPSNLIERRFISPVIDRLFGGYPDLTYASALRANELPPNVEVISDNAFNPHPARLRPVEHTGIGSLELAERHLVAVAGAEVGLGEWRGQAPRPLPEKALNCGRTQPVTDLLRGGGVARSAESVVQGLYMRSPLSPTAVWPTRGH